MQIKLKISYNNFSTFDATVKNITSYQLWWIREIKTLSSVKGGNGTLFQFFFQTLIQLSLNIFSRKTRIISSNSYVYFEIHCIVIIRDQSNTFRHDAKLTYMQQQNT